jgi:hypothetical protein
MCLLLASLSVPLTRSFAQANRITFVQSTLDTDLDGWTSNTPAEATWSATGGDPGGFIRFQDASAVQTYITAPPKFLGDYSGLNGAGSIQFEHRIFQETQLIDLYPYEVRLSGPGGAATWDGPTPAGTNDWTTISAPLDLAAWSVTGGAWTDLLTNIDRLEINIELAQNDNHFAVTDIEGIDNVQVVPFLQLPPPNLSIQATNNNRVTLAWPSMYPNYVLLQSLGLGAANWVLNTDPVTASNGISSVTVGSEASALFFRLGQR